ncbi:MAG TPA: sulfite exporter TauE/SafE family protein [Spirochaetota bacterium]|nr:sulfite exporter TauE/SafE family protein [Spirochaetota bacterium]HPI91105.1 sulfite exporter TauE/SafE family protein [Spirochaetota bacterium]HPR48688.1 sulfite exporter TauE/SafE family protein [Spirochaetota bacterium]
MSFEYWYMFPVSIVIAILANSSGFSGGVLFQPIYNLLLHIPIQNAVATGIATETVGMTSGAIRYIWYKMVELPIGFTMIMLAIPGIVIGNHALLVINGDLLKLTLGVIILGIATMQLVNALRHHFGTRENIPIEDIYGYMWVPPISGFFSATTGTGICELSQPVLEKGLNIKTKRANATAILIEATADWIITILNLHAGLIMWELWVFTGTGVIIGGQIGPYVSRYLPEKLIKIIFSIAIIVIGIFYVYKGIMWIVTR